MRWAVEMSSGIMIYIQKFHKNWFRHSKVDRDKQHDDLISLLLFFPK
jgi:hypothetical protein